ncbi:hypothetical protein NGM33_19190 [Nocardiopsis dassonvillei]|uniref:hypothetical protein n=1 Tax=Nocardiopsis dassonvillei TaxID=2014 RepID=UPI00102CC781|nr:hypothetical protein [Nocardiopsis dassonvillei]MCP3015452.1 hypothetical protein [Nocardiopsis dassonvillei]
MSPTHDTTTSRIARLRASRSRRRNHTLLLVLVFLVATVLLTAALFQPGATLTMIVLVPAYLVLLVAAAVVHRRLSRATGVTAGYRNLDERQRAELDRATRLGHRVTSALIFAPFLVIAVLEGPTPDHLYFPEELFMPVLWVIYMAHVAVPTLYLAWTQPDEIPDDEEV